MVDITKLIDYIMTIHFSYNPDINKDKCYINDITMSELLFTMQGYCLLYLKKSLFQNDIFLTDVFLYDLYIPKVIYYMRDINYFNTLYSLDYFLSREYINIIDIVLRQYVIGNKYPDRILRTYYNSYYRQYKEQLEDDILVINCVKQDAFIVNNSLLHLFFGMLLFR